MFLKKVISHYFSPHEVQKLIEIVFGSILSEHSRMYSLETISQKENFLGYSVPLGYLVPLMVYFAKTIPVNMEII